ncbi:flagellar motor protein MotA [Brevundimonas sp. AAP58]|uniref:MotA/TolQ/ExbB proton channel family protein n=1 Tax=Brevundimonas sp. AAP58 TaxID=1523422 RepID=UPI0006B8DAE8|nr:MotA/TolQ/ExbB proton channel family protein [Brevundimonas sp. AAP58]KPF81078.1 flagellar motor protein MotA [Brevundimonas sp. AAP58]
MQKTNILLALAGAAVLMASSPALAQAPAAPAAEATAAAAPAADAAAPAAEATSSEDPTTVAEAAGGGHGGSLTPISMFMIAHPVVQVVMIGLLLASIFTWTLLIIKLIEFAGVNSKTNRFLENFRQARTIADMRKVATADEYDGNPLADMAAAATEEVELARQSGLSVTGEHRDSTIARASTAVAAVQSGIAGRLSGGQQFLASTGSGGPFIGLFGTVYGIMNSFIGIAESNTTNLAVVAPGIAEALLATGIGLFAAIPAVIFYNYFNTRIAAYGTRADGFQAELLNGISRQLDKGA